MYDLLIIGGGPAGVAAGIYAARKKIKTALITDGFGGQSLVSADIQNWIGEISISGFDLAQKMEAHLKAQKDIEVIEGDLVVKISPINSHQPSVVSSISSLGFRAESKSGKILESKTLLITTGSHHKKLNVSGESELNGKGVVYCSTCDAPLFNGKDVAVVGGGNSGLEAVVDLLPYASKIYLLHRREELKGDPITQEKIKTNPKVEIILNAETQSIFGEAFVSGMKYLDKVSGSVKELAVQGVFVEVGSEPNSALVKDLVKTDEWGRIVIDHKTQKTSNQLIWAAGDVSDGLYKQNNISMGDAVKAVLSIYDYLNRALTS